MMPVVYDTVDDLKAHVGESLGTSEWLAVEQEQVDVFADVTRDHQWIHVDPERARDSAFGGTIAHGYLTLSLIPGFAREVYDIRAGSARLNFGLDKVRFPAPLPVGSRVRAEARLMSVDRTGSGSKVTITWTISRDGGDRPVCVAESIILIVD